MDFVQQWIVPPPAWDHPVAYIITALLALLVTAVSKGGFGAGVGVIAAPLMYQVAPFAFVNGMWLPVLVACDMATVRKFPREWNPRSFWLIAPGMTIGTLAGAFLLAYFSRDAQDLALMKHREAWLKFIVSMIAVTFVIIPFVYRPPADAPAWKPKLWQAIPIGIAAGITTMFGHAAGAILIMYMLPQKLDQRIFTGTTGRFFLAFNSLKIPFFIWIAGQLTAETFSYALWLMLIGPLGVLLGAWLNKRLSPIWFVRVTYGSLAVAAGKLLYDWLKTVVF